MRCVLCALVVACVAATASAGPLDRNAGSKINGDMIGTPAPAAARVYAANPAYVANPAQANPAPANRSFSYAPAPAKAPAAAAAPRQTQAVPAPPVQRTSPQARRYSYSYQPAAPVYRRQQPTSRSPGYLHADRKAKFEYGN